MAGICSAHWGPEPEPGCAACAADIRDAFPYYDEMVARAEAAGRHTCECGFVYFKTTRICPLCCKPGRWAMEQMKTCGDFVQEERERIAAWVKWRLSGEGSPGMGPYPDDDELGEELAAVIRKGVP